VLFLARHNAIAGLLYPSSCTHYVLKFEGLLLVAVLLSVLA
jgi:hypothetical protein